MRLIVLFQAYICIKRHILQNIMDIGVPFFVVIIITFWGKNIFPMSLSTEKR